MSNEKKLSIVLIVVLLMLFIFSIFWTYRIISNKDNTSNLNINTNTNSNINTNINTNINKNINNNSNQNENRKLISFNSVELEGRIIYGQ